MSKTVITYLLLFGFGFEEINIYISATSPSRIPSTVLQTGSFVWNFSNKDTEFYTWE